MNYQLRLKALDIAASAHKNQTRKVDTNIPYIAHPFSVGMVLQGLGYGEDVIIAGFLHDVFEDTLLTRDDIQREFGSRVLEMIESLSEDKDHRMSREEKRRTWKSRKEAYLQKLKSASPDVMAIACADAYCNLVDTEKDAGIHGIAVERFFNISLKDIVEYNKKRIELFLRDVKAPYSVLIPQMIDIVDGLERLVSKG